jgi:hypothetical protein
MLKKLKNPRLVYPLMMAPTMALIMSGVMSFIHFGLVENFFQIWMKSFAIAVCVAFPTILILAPRILKLTQRICQ